MALTLTSRPLTNYVAAGNPLLYKFQRKDYTVASVANSGGKIQIVVNGIDLSLIYTVGSTGWFTSDNGVYNQAVSVFSVAFAVNTTITFNEAYTSAATTGWTNTYTRTQYKVEVEIFDSVTNLNPFGTLTFSYAPDKAGLAKCDVSKPIRNLITPDITSPLTQYTWFTDLAVESFYIKYREVWTSSANSQTSDSANIRNAVFSSRQVGDSNNQLNYPSILGGIYAAWKTPYNVFTFLNDGTANRYLRLTENNLSFYLPIDTYTGLRSIAWEGFKNSFVVQTATAAIDWTAINKSQWQVVLGIGQTSEDAGQIIRANNVSFDLSYEITMTATGTFTLSFLVYSEAGTLLTTQNVAITAVAGTQTGTVTINQAAIVKRVDARISSVATAGQTITLRTGLNFNSALSAALVTTTTAPAADTVTSTLPSVQVRDYCNNQFNVIWRNRFGGLTNYVFQANQDFYFTYSNKKARQYVLYVEQVTDEHLDLIEDLNTIGTVYEVPFDELSSSVILTSKRIGAAVYRCVNGVLTGIIVIPTAGKFKTMAVKNRTAITVEMPEVL